MKHVSMRIKISGVESITLNRFSILLPRREKSRRSVPDRQWRWLFRGEAFDATWPKVRETFAFLTLKRSRGPNIKAGIPTQPPRRPPSHFRPQSIRRQLSNDPSPPTHFLSLQRQGISRYCRTSKTTAGGRWRNRATEEGTTTTRSKRPSHQIENRRRNFTNQLDGAAN
jgi:hypothetical protein